VIASASANVERKEWKLHPDVGPGDRLLKWLTPMPKGLLERLNWACPATLRSGPIQTAVSYPHVRRPRAHRAAVSTQSASDRYVAKLSRRRRTPRSYRGSAWRLFADERCDVARVSSCSLSIVATLSMRAPGARTRPAPPRLTGLQTWSDIENGRRTNLAIETLERLDKALAVRAADLLK